MATISSLGSSGLPLQDTLDKLQEAEEQRLKLITNQQTSNQTRISAFGKIQSAVEALKKAASDLNGMGGTNILSNKITGEGVTSSITTGATAGTYNIKVSKLATAQSLQTQAYGSRIDNMGTGGTVTFTIDGRQGKPSSISRPVSRPCRAGSRVAAGNCVSIRPARALTSSWCTP